MMVHNQKFQQMKQEAISDILDVLESGFDGYYCDLHHEVFNTDYYVIGTSAAKKILTELDVFECIELVQNYEKDNFGEVCTELSNPEKLLNMVYYIVGDEVICEMNDIPEFSDNWNSVADNDTNAAIAQAMKEMYCSVNV